jgi:hypothetical protein
VCILQRRQTKQLKRQPDILIRYRTRSTVHTVQYKSESREVRPTKCSPTLRQLHPQDINIISQIRRSDWVILSTGFILRVSSELLTMSINVGSEETRLECLKSNEELQNEFSYHNNKQSLPSAASTIPFMDAKCYPCCHRMLRELLGVA